MLLLRSLWTARKPVTASSNDTSCPSSSRYAANASEARVGESCSSVCPKLSFRCRIDMISPSACSRVSKYIRCRLPVSDHLAGTFRHHAAGRLSHSIFFASSFGHFIAYERIVLRCGRPLFVALCCPYGGILADEYG